MHPLAEKYRVHGEEHSGLSCVRTGFLRFQAFYLSLPRHLLSLVLFVKFLDH